MLHKLCFIFVFTVSRDEMFVKCLWFVCAINPKLDLPVVGKSILGKLGTVQ